MLGCPTDGPREPADLLTTPNGGLIRVGVVNASVRLMRSVNDFFRVRIRGSWCLYCGEVATTVDHFPPLAYAGANGRGVLLPACRECNSYLGARWPVSLEGRIIGAKSGLRKKYKKFIDHIPWSDEELQGMSTKLQKEYAGWRQKRNETLARLAWNAQTYLALIVQFNDFAALRVALGFSPENEPEWFTLLAQATD